MLGGVMISFTECTNNVDCSKYYVVHHNNHYSICYKKDVKINGYDEKYYNVNNNKLIGMICKEGDNFDYNNHRLGDEFLFSKQVIALTDVIKNKELSQQTFKNLSDSDVIKSAVDSYYYCCQYETNIKLDYSEITTDLSVFKINDEYVIGYDLTKQKNIQYIYDINTFDVLKCKPNDIIKKYKINSDKENISYFECQENLEKVKQKVMNK